MLSRARARPLVCLSPASLPLSFFFLFLFFHHSAPCPPPSVTRDVKEDFGSARHALASVSLSGTCHYVNSIASHVPIDAINARLLVSEAVNY